MADIDTSQLDTDQRSPRLARPSLMEAVELLNLVQGIITFPLNSDPVTITRALHVNGALEANSFKGEGSQLTALNASNLTTGQVPVARMGTGATGAGKVLYGDGTWKDAPAGGGGSSGPAKLFPTQSRYQANKTTGQGVNIVSAASLKYGISWTRDGTQLTVQDANHGRSVGERAVVRNAHVEQHEGLITSVGSGFFTMDCTDTGATNGSAAAYSMGFTFAFNAGAGSITGGTITAPANWDCVLLSLRIHLAANTRGATTFNLTVPKGNINGVGPNTNSDDMCIPVQQVRQDVSGLTAVGNTIIGQIGGDFGVYQFGALPAATTGIHILATF